MVASCSTFFPAFEAIPKADLCLPTDHNVIAKLTPNHDRDPVQFAVA